MEMNHLDKSIKMVSRRVNNINLGGCGIFAFELYKILKFEFGIETEIVFSGYRSCEKICFDHIMLLVMNPDHVNVAVWIDSTGVRYQEPGGFRNYMELNELASLLEDKSLWNKSFHYYFSDHNFNIISNENFLRCMIYKYISHRIPTLIDD